MKEVSARFAAYRRGVRALTRPSVVAVSAALLLLDWSLLPNRPGARSRCARYCPVSLNERGVVGSGPQDLKMAVYRTPHGLEARFRWIRTPHDWRQTGVAVFPPRMTDTGFWGLTLRTRSGVLLIGKEELSQLERDELVEVLIRGIESEDGVEAMRPSYDLLKGGNAPSRQVLPGGYVHNALAMVLGVIVAIGMPRLVAAPVRRAIKVRTERISVQRLDCGWCPRCGYDLRRDFSRPCPECGWEVRTRA